MRETGIIYLVGAGPGDPGLLTLRGKQLIERADVVLYDRLVGEEILSLLPEKALLIDVGKNAGHHLIPQEEINALILRYAGEGKRVVRLKGGDPYLFGRGAEELEAVVEAGIPFEVVPGVTSAIAVPSYGGIPVSHRDFASSVHIITGHLRHGRERNIPYRQLTELGGTLVFLMGVGAITELSAGLQGAGMPPTMPCALVENGTRPGQRRVNGTLADIAGQAEKEAVQPPAVFVVGEVCTLSEQLDWFSGRASSGLRPLSGVRTVVTRPKATAGELTGRLRELGCEVIELPCIRTEPLPVPSGLLERLSAFDWIAFTSPAGAEHFFSLLEEHRFDIRALGGAKLAAIGSKTAAVLERRGIYPDLVPEKYSASALAEELSAKMRQGDSLLLFRAKEGTPALPESLGKAGFAVEDIAAYETFYEHPDGKKVAELLAEGKLDYLTFTSAMTVEGFVGAVGEADFSGPTAVCIGEETAEAARKRGFRVAVSERATIDSMVDCILELEEKD
ncbi:MAG: uroporphyrinogen-III C-methyltransferase [Oscillospiraceae bacterium]